MSLILMLEPTFRSHVHALDGRSLIVNTIAHVLPISVGPPQLLERVGNGCALLAHFAIPDHVLNFAPVDSAVAKQLIDKIYEKRKAAALELEKCVRSWLKES